MESLFSTINVVFQQRNDETLKDQRNSVCNHQNLGHAYTIINVGKEENVLYPNILGENEIDKP